MVPMNWKLILGLSLFGLGMAFATVFVISPRVEPLFWLAIFVICAFVIARQAPLRPFLHGFLLGIVNSVWITGAHVLFFNRYLAGHPQEAAMMQGLHATGAVPRVAMALVGPAIGLISGAVIGILAYICTKILRPSGTETLGRARKASAGRR